MTYSHVYYRRKYDKFSKITKWRRGAETVLELATTGVIAGAMLGRYKVMALITTVIFIIILTPVVGAARADRPWSVLSMMVVLVVALEVGYLVGIAIREAAQAIAARPQGAAIPNCLTPPRNSLTTAISTLPRRRAAFVTTKGCRSSSIRHTLHMQLGSGQQGGYESRYTGWVHIQPKPGRQNIQVIPVNWA
jgi:hypothetical protein